MIVCSGAFLFAVTRVGVVDPTAIVYTSNGVVGPVVGAAENTILVPSLLHCGKISSRKL